MNKPLILIIALVVLTGCAQKRFDSTDLAPDRSYRIRVDTILGHAYLTTSFYTDAISTIHAEHCQCKGGGK